MHRFFKFNNFKTKPDFILILKMLRKKIAFYMQCNTRISAKGTTYKPMHNTAVRQPQKTNIKIIVCAVCCCCCCCLFDSDGGKRTREEICETKPISINCIVWCGILDTTSSYQWSRGIGFVICH